MFITGYLVEKSLGVVNLFVIAMVFEQFGIPWHISTGPCSGASAARWSCGPR